MFVDQGFDFHLFQVGKPQQHLVLANGGPFGEHPILATTARFLAVHDLPLNSGGNHDFAIGDLLLNLGQLALFDFQGFLIVGGFDLGGFNVAGQANQLLFAGNLFQYFQLFQPEFLEVLGFLQIVAGPGDGKLIRVFLGLGDEALAGELGAVLEHGPGLGGFLLGRGNLSLGVKDLVFDRLLRLNERTFLVLTLCGHSSFQSRFGLNHCSLGIGQRDFLLLLFLLKAGGVKLDEEVARFHDRPFLNHLDHRECAVPSPSDAANLDVLATLDLPLVEDLGDEVSFFGRRDQRVKGGIASTLFLQKQKAKQQHRQSGDDDQNHRSGDPLPAFENLPVVESNAGPGKLWGRGALSNTFHGRWPVGQEASDWG